LQRIHKIPFFPAGFSLLLICGKRFATKLSDIPEGVGSGDWSASSNHGNGFD
jgi:hypothetical protein